MKRVRFLMVGGFLGAGKTTALARLARHYIGQGKRVALVTNDQAQGLVDTQSLRAQGFDVGEVSGACFCCKFDDLVSIVQQLDAEHRPDIILAEPVGSCTDLLSTVVEPLRQLHADTYETGPLAVLLKPEHGQKILAEQPGVGFSPKAAYIFLKQLEEADIVVLNKVDKLAPAEVERLLALVRERFPGKTVLAGSMRQGTGLDQLIDALDHGESTATSPEVDYDIYAAGEAELGWLNATFALTPTAGAKPFALDALLVDLVGKLAQALKAAGGEPAHLKILGQADGATAIANLVASAADVELSVASGATVAQAELSVNARVAMAPEDLTEVIRAGVEQASRELGTATEIRGLQSFRPGRPVPTHRLPVGVA